MLPICSKTLLPASPGSQTFGRGGGCHVAVSSLRQANARLLMVQERGPSSAYRRQWYNGTSRDLVTKSLISQSWWSPSTELRNIFFVIWILFCLIDRSTETLWRWEMLTNKNTKACTNVLQLMSTDLPSARPRSEFCVRNTIFFCLNPECTSVRYCSLLNLFLI